jgi:hypothetical protein
MSIGSDFNFFLILTSLLNPLTFNDTRMSMSCPCSRSCPFPSMFMSISKSLAMYMSTVYQCLFPSPLPRPFFSCPFPRFHVHVHVDVHVHVHVSMIMSLSIFHDHVLVMPMFMSISISIALSISTFIYFVHTCVQTFICACTGPCLYLFVCTCTKTSSFSCTCLYT